MTNPDSARFRDASAGASLADQLDDPALGIAEELIPGTPLIIFFGGYAGGFGMPPFSFARLAASLETSKLFIRDLKRQWYQRGVAALGSDVPGICAGLERRIAAAKPTRVVAVGNSAGGYAALLFGSLLGFDEVHAFAPQTTIEFLSRSRAGDFRALPDTMHLLTLRDRRYLNVRPHLRGRPHIHYSTAEPLDVWHAARVQDLAELHAYPFSDHFLVKALKDDGTLQRLLAGAINGQGPGSTGPSGSA